MARLVEEYWSMDGGVLVGGVHLYWSRRGGVVLHTMLHYWCVRLTTMRGRAEQGSIESVMASIGAATVRIMMREVGGCAECVAEEKSLVLSQKYLIFA